MTEHSDGIGSAALYGTSDWRADGWENIFKTAHTGDAFRGLRKDGTWWNVKVRVLEGIMDGRHHCRYVWAAWHENGRYCEASWECFAALCQRIESLPSSVPTGSPSFLFCDGCGEVHEETDDFVICECGRVSIRMEWATPAQIAAAKIHRTNAQSCGASESELPPAAGTTL